MTTAEPSRSSTPPSWAASTRITPGGWPGTRTCGPGAIGISPRPGNSRRTWFQDTFEAAARDWKTLRELDQGQQRAWLRNTLSHKETDQFRRRRVWRLKLLPELRRRYPAAEPDPEQQALSALALERAAKLIEGLPDEQRVIALMKWNDHMTEAEIAARLGCERGEITAQVRKIRGKLIEGLGRYYPFSGDDGGGQAS